MSISRRAVLGGLAGASVLAAACYSLFRRPRADGHPNILLITADDLGLQLGCYGDSVNVTPHIDRLASSGIRFQHAYVTHGSCSPSRASILTGLYSHQHGMDGLAHLGYTLKPGLPTLFSVLHEAGYRTGLIGKNHVSGGLRGCDIEVPLSRLEAGKGVGRFAEVCRELFDQRDPRPFFLMVNYTDPHTPFEREVSGVPQQPVNPGDVSPFPFQKLDAPRLRERIAGYYNNLKRFDVGVGWLLEELAASGKAADTLVILTSDQGPPFARSKTTVYEAGLKVPLILRWPGKSAPGRVIEELVSMVDLFPTLCEIAGVQEASDNLDGRSLAPFLSGQPARWRRYLFAEFTSHGVQSFYPRRSVRDERYKLIVNLLAPRGNPARSMDGNGSWEVSRDAVYEGTQVRAAFDRYANPPKVELYDLMADPYEFVDLGDSPALEEVRRRLAAALQAWREKTGDPLLNETYLAEMTAHHDQLVRKGSRRYEGL